MAMENILRIVRNEDEGAQTQASQAERIVEALLFASAEPLGVEQLSAALPHGTDVMSVLKTLQARYAGRGVELHPVAGRWLFRTASDLGYLLTREAPEPRKLSRAAMETLSIIAYHQPATRAEIEEIRGVATAKGTLDVLLEIGWIRMRGRRRSPGRPVTYGTTDAFLIHFGLDSIADLPGIEELKGAGLIEGKLPNGFQVPTPTDDAELQPDEEPLGADLFQTIAEERANEVEAELDPSDGEGGAS